MLSDEQILDLIVPKYGREAAMRVLARDRRELESVITQEMNSVSDSESLKVSVTKDMPNQT